MTALGTHLLADFYGCEPALLDDPQRLRAAMFEAVERSGATVMGECFRRFEPHGVTGVIVISESHLALHTWPEHGYAGIDFFTCGPRVDPSAAIAHLEVALRPSRTEVRQVMRGGELAGARYKP